MRVTRVDIENFKQFERVRVDLARFAGVRLPEDENVDSEKVTR